MPLFSHNNANNDANTPRNTGDNQFTSDIDNTTDTNLNANRGDGVNPTHHNHLHKNNPYSASNDTPAGGLGNQQYGTGNYENNLNQQQHIPGRQEDFNAGAGRHQGPQNYDNNVNQQQSGTLRQENFSTGTNAPNAQQYPTSGGMTNQAGGMGGVPNSNDNMISPTTGSAHNSQSLREQAESKARESSALQKQSTEIAKAEQLERAAIEARAKAVDHGAHPLHGQAGGIRNNNS